MEYKIYKEDYSFQDYFWWQLTRMQEQYPEYCDMFDRDGEIGEEYDDSFNVDVYHLAHENIRLYDLEVVQKFLLDSGTTTCDMDEDITETIAKHWDDRGQVYFQLAGDDGGLGFILDIWDSKELDGEPVHMYQFWFDDYDGFIESI